jgi:hypothetical protein
MKKLVSQKTKILKYSERSFFENLDVNLTTDSDTGQLDAYIKNAEWDLEGC